LDKHTKKQHKIHKKILPFKSPIVPECNCIIGPLL